MTQQKDLVDAFEAFIVGCKADGIWDAIKACCVLAAWDGINGALIPLKGAAPTNFNFVSGDYDRKTGLKGDGSTKYLDSNRNNNADPQNSQHLAVWASSATQEQSLYISSSIGTEGTGASGIGVWISNFLFFRCQTSVSSVLPSGSGSATGLLGISRSSSASFSYRAAQTNHVSVSESQTPRNGNVAVFAEDGTSLYRSSSRLSFYSIGESLDLAKLDARVSTLITAIGAAV